MIKKLKLRFIIINMTIVTLVLGLCLGIINIVFRNYIRIENVSMMQGLAFEDAKRPKINEEPPGLRLPFFTLSYDESGRLKSEGGYYDMSDEELLREIYDKANMSKETVGEIDEYNLRFLKQNGPKGEFIVFSDMASELNLTKTFTKTSLLVGFAAYLVFFVISVVLANWTVKPTEQAWNQQKQFVADASHDLKTPLTVILTNSEILQGKECNDNRRMKLASDINTMSSQMKSLIEKMLDLAKVEAVQPKEEFTTVNLSKIVCETVLTFEPLFYESGLKLEENIQEDVQINGMESELKKLVAIFLDNAKKYSFSNTTTNIKLEKLGTGCMLSVASKGEEISQKDRENLFKRFYRADKARSLNHSYGLGLAIAEGIVNKHKGKIWCESKNNINTFFVKL